MIEKLVSMIRHPNTIVVDEVKYPVEESLPLFYQQGVEDAKNGNKVVVYSTGVPRTDIPAQEYAKGRESVSKNSVVDIAVNEVLVVPDSQKEFDVFRKEFGNKYAGKLRIKDYDSPCFLESDDTDTVVMLLEYFSQVSEKSKEVANMIIKSARSDDNIDFTGFAQESHMGTSFVELNKLFGFSGDNYNFMQLCTGSSVFSKGKGYRIDVKGQELNLETHNGTKYDLQTHWK